MLANDPGVPADKVLSAWGVGGGVWGRMYGFALGASGWYGEGLGTAWALGNTAVDSVGVLRKHFGFWGIANYRISNFELAGALGGVGVDETERDRSPDNQQKISVIKSIRLAAWRRTIRR